MNILQIIWAFIRSLFFFIFFYVGSAFIIILGVPSAYISTRGLRRLARMWSQYHYGCARVFLGIKVKIIGEFRNDTLLYVFKHESMFEAIDTLRILKDPIVIAKKELLQIPLWGRMATKHGLLGVDREAGAKSMREIMRQANRAVDEGRPIVIFPEGTRMAHGEKPLLQSGFAGIYRIFNIPAIPVALNSGLVAPRHKFLKKSGTITYLIGDELAPGIPKEEIRELVHIAINALND